MALIESLGSGIPRILRAYGEDCFKFTDNFIRITLPISVQDGTQSVPNIENLDKLIVFCTEARSFGEMLAFMGLTDRTKFRKNIFIHFWKLVSWNRLSQTNLKAGIKSIN